MTVEISVSTRETQIGRLRAAVAGGNLVSVELTEKACCDVRKNQADEAIIEQVFYELQQYFAGTRARFDVPWVLTGIKSEFDRRVLTELAKVSYGTTITYGELAKRVGNARAARAVGNALNRNPLLIVIPCHRVVSTNGKIGGFKSGLNCKRRLHDIEGISRLL